MALGDGTSWDETNPTNATNLSDGDDHIVDVRKGVRIRMEYEHSTLGSASAGGKHKFMTMQTQATKPTVDATQTAALYVKDVGSGVIELFYEDEAGNEIQVTSGSALNTTAIAGVQGSGKNIVAAYASASTITITADELVVMDTSNNKASIYSVSETLDITASGASGLDTGAEAANTIYYAWIIRKSSDGTVNGLLSLSSTAPTMPSGYDQKALVSCVGNNNSSNFISFTQTGKKYNFTTWAVMKTGYSTPNVLEAVDMTPANLSTNPGFVPSGLSNFCYGFMAGSNDSAVMSNKSTGAGSGNEPNELYHSYTGAWSLPWAFDILTADTLYLSCGQGTTKTYLQGFDCNKLG